MSVRKPTIPGATGRELTGGNDRFGYRPTPGKRTPAELLFRQQGRTDRQKLLDKIHWQRLKKAWNEENKQKDREQWVDLGNKNLPIEQYRSDIMKMVATNRVSLLSGETGSGKSTQLAQYALEMGYDHIVYLQPRRVTTDGIAERIEEELTETFSQRGIEMPERLVGMAHSERATMGHDSVIQVMTSAVFSSRVPEIQEQWKDKKVLIVADEVHEGNIETEFAVAAAAELLTEQNNWNMVLMSATMNEKEIQDAYAPINGRPIPNIEVKGRPHTIEYNEAPDKDVVDVFESSCRDGNKTIIFTEGRRAMGAIENELRRRFPEVRVLRLHSKITDEERHEIFKADVPGVHTVIISTSAGQSGITIPGVDRVISDGMTKSPELDAENAAGLPSRPCSQAELTQQMGRGGRDIEGGKFFLARQIPYKNGKSVHLDTPFLSLSEREAHAPADIYHTIITKNVLRAAAMGRDFYRLNDFLIHNVSHGTIEEAYLVLKMLGAVNSDNECTSIGQMMDKMPLRPELARAVVEAVQNGTRQQQHQVAAIAAAMEAGGLGGDDPVKIKHNHQNLPLWARDDFFAELAYFDAMMRRGLMNPEADDQQVGNEQGVPQFNFDWVNVKRANKQYSKICYRMGLEPMSDETLLSDELTPEDVNTLKDMLLKGMPHLIYEKVGQRTQRGRRKRLPDGSREQRPPLVYFRNVLAPDKDIPYDYDRVISNRSALIGRTALSGVSLVAGYARWYYDDNDVLHNVVERSIAIDRKRVSSALGTLALSVREHTVIGPDGHLRAITEGYIGSLRTRASKKQDVADTRTKAELLVERSHHRPGSAQRELRELKSTLEMITRRIPKRLRQYFIEKDIVTHEHIEELLFEAAKGAASDGHLDSRLRIIMHEKAMRLDDYIRPDMYDKVLLDMPNDIMVGDSIYDIHYTDDDHATPYIQDFPLEVADSLPTKLAIPDGREVFLRYSYDDGDKRYLTAAEVRQMRARDV